MKCLDFDWQINEFMVYCRSTQLREKSMASYEQALRLQISTEDLDMDDRTICLPAQNTKGRKNRFVFFSVKTA